MNISNKNTKYMGVHNPMFYLGKNYFKNFKLALGHDSSYFDKICEADFIKKFDFNPTDPLFKKYMAR